MEVLSNLMLGFGVAADPANLAYCFIGVFLGTVIGVLPGVGPTATIAMLLPITFSLSPAASLIMLAGIYYGAQYGGSTTAILVNLPGEAASAVTAIDGYEMARQGRAGPALAIAALGSFAAGTIATVVVALFAIPMTKLALSFYAPEYFSLIVLGLIASVTLARGSVTKAIAMIMLGLLVGSIGTDMYTGLDRFTFGFLELSEGVSVVAIAVGIFGVTEILRNLEDESDGRVLIAPITSLMPTRADIRASIGPVLRGTVIGSILGVLPGGGAMLSSFASYSIEKKISKDSTRFGRGAIEGVAGPESANNAGAQTSFIPMLTLGVPGNSIMALMISAMIIQGVVPGPNVVTERPDLFWGIVASMWIGNLFLVVLNLPLVGIWVKLLRVPYTVLFPTILTFSAIGVFAVNSASFDIFVLAICGLTGYFLSRQGCEPAPFMLGFVLGPMLEENLRRSLLLSQGDPTVFLTRPISCGLLALAAVTLTLLILPSIRKRRDVVFVEE